MDFSQTVSVEQPSVAASAEEGTQPERGPDGTLVFNILAKQPCIPGIPKEGEIVVCAPDPDQYRYRELPVPPEEQPARAEMQVAPGVKAGLRVVPGGATGDPAATVNVRLNF